MCSVRQAVVRLLTPHLVEEEALFHNTNKIRKQKYGHGPRLYPKRRCCAGEDQQKVTQPDTVR
jgi:hypothetical protein